MKPLAVSLHTEQPQMVTPGSESTTSTGECDYLEASFDLQSTASAEVRLHIASYVLCTPWQADAILCSSAQQPLKGALSRCVISEGAPAVGSNVTVHVHEDVCRARISREHLLQFAAEHQLGVGDDVCFLLWVSFHSCSASRLSLCTLQVPPHSSAWQSHQGPWSPQHEERKAFWQRSLSLQWVQAQPGAWYACVQPQASLIPSQLLVAQESVTRRMENVASIKFLVKPAAGTVWCGSLRRAVPAVSSRAVQVGVAFTHNGTSKPETLATILATISYRSCSKLHITSQVELCVV